MRFGANAPLFLLSCLGACQRILLFSCLEGFLAARPTARGAPGQGREGEFFHF
jgi:hypothetical protein